MQMGDNQGRLNAQQGKLAMEFNKLNLERKDGLPAVLTAKKETTDEQ